MDNADVPEPEAGVDIEPDDDLARAALAGARTTRPGRARDGRGARRRIRRENLAGRGTPERRATGYSAPGPDPERDPQLLGPLLADCVEELGWQQPLSEGRVFADWAQLVGADVAAHCRPETLRAGELRIAAESSAWATQLRLLAGTLLARLVAELGPGVITKLVISGPAAPSWKHGAWSVRGARGPRDTYG